MATKYSDMEKEFNLPSQDNLMREFDINHFDEMELPLPEVMKKLSERIEHYAKILEEIIQPDAGYSSYHETGSFDDRNDINELFRKLMYHYRNLLLAELSNENSDKAKAIMFFWNDWMKIKPRFVKVVKMLRGSWEKEKIQKMDSGYLG
ncbi:hypothetical protein JW868_02260 [Candidatus Woesearchaeota archaeon]|nr:hypothetical protein [Candidatus Woesearchaeota archaeon]